MLSFQTYSQSCDDMFAQFTKTPDVNIHINKAWFVRENIYSLIVGGIVLLVCKKSDNICTDMKIKGFNSSVCHNKFCLMRHVLMYFYIIFRLCKNFLWKILVD